MKTLTFPKPEFSSKILLTTTIYTTNQVYTKNVSNFFHSSSILFSLAKSESPFFTFQLHFISSLKGGMLYHGSR